MNKYTVFFAQTACFSAHVPTFPAASPRSGTLDGLR